MNHKELDLWKKSIEYVSIIYASTKEFPSDEKFGLTSQLRRAAVSIPTNISEGAARNSNKEFIHFLYIALGSESEVETLLTISVNLEYIEKEDFNVLISLLDDIKKMTLGLIKYLKNKS